MGNFKEKLKKVKAFIFDVDGVLTDGLVYLHPSGEQVRAMNIKDGYAIQLAVKKGYNICIISGGNSASVKERFNKLGVTDIYLNAYHKMDAFEDFLFKYGISTDSILYMGDDIPDYDIMRKVSLPTCPADAVREIKEISCYISDKKGGEGCARDVLEQVMRLQGTWMENDEAKKW